MTETVKVRIAVAVDGVGNWCAGAASSGYDVRELPGEVRELFVWSFNYEPRAVHFIEAEVPLALGTIPATVSPAEGE